MLKVSQMDKLHVLKPKKGQTGDPEKMDAGQLSKIGKIHLTVCSPNGRRVVGFLIRRPDIAGMIKQKDVFIALDSIAVSDYGFVATRGDDSFDEAAQKRLGLDWEKCIIWAGMDAKTTDGHELGWVADFTFDAKTGSIKTFYVGDGGVASSLVGYVEIPVDMLRGYSKGFMLVDPAASKLALDGGLAAKAGEGYAKAKVEGKAAGKKVAKAAGSAVEKGAYGLGRLIGKTKRAIEVYQRDDEEELPASGPVEVESSSEPVEKPKLNASGREPEADADLRDAAAEGTDAASADGANPEEPVEESLPSDGQAGDADTEAKMRTFVPASELKDDVSPTEGGQADVQPHAAQAGSTSAASKGGSEPKATPAASPAKGKATSKSFTGQGSRPASGKKQKRSTGDEAARALGRGLGKMNSRMSGMFGSFVEEYKKSSK